MTERRCRLVGTDTLGTILENHGNGWLTILWDGAPTPCDLWAPLTRGLVEVV
jgi:hypothetical protein